MFTPSDVAQIRTAWVVLPVSTLCIIYVCVQALCGLFSGGNSRLEECNFKSERLHWHNEIIHSVVDRPAQILSDLKQTTIVVK